MNDITYGTIMEIYTLGDNKRISYGIAVYSDTNHSGTATIILSIHDISSEKKQIDDIVSHCNFYHLSPEHLADVIDDFMTS